MQRSSAETGEKYLTKPTIIMCNPNALIYQQMVTAPNAYWLNFFLKREINVICWNYRGYGESELGTFENMDPYKSKRDVEKVLAFGVNNLKLRGKFGVYGRSIGGIAACHLAQKFPDLIQTLIVDRSFTEISGVATSKLKGSMTDVIFRLLTYGWQCKDAENYNKSANCYKIVTCDPIDDTIDQFVNCCSGVARIQAKINYNTKEFRDFHESLLYTCNYERQLYEKLD